MRFFIVKHEQICKGCKSEMVKNEEAVAIRINGFPLTFHIECFLEWNSETFMYRLKEWRQRQTKSYVVKKKRGRKRVYKNSTKANRIRCMYNYYIKKGITDKADKLYEELTALRT